MGVLRQGSVMTTRGVRKAQAPQCWTCHERRPGEIYGIDPNGSPICATCLGDKALPSTCDDEICACGKVKIDDSVLD